MQTQLHLAAFFESDKICTRLHRSKLNSAHDEKRDDTCTPYFQPSGGGSSSGASRSSGSSAQGFRSVRGSQGVSRSVTSVPQIVLRGLQHVALFVILLVEKRRLLNNRFRNETTGKGKEEFQVNTPIIYLLVTSS